MVVKTSIGALFTALLLTASSISGQAVPVFNSEAVPSAWSGILYSAPVAPTCGMLYDFAVSASDSRAAAASTYELTFKVTGDNLSKIVGGGVSFYFPKPFTLDSVSAVTLVADTGKPLLTISRLVVSGQHLTAYLGRNQVSPNEDLAISLIGSVSVISVTVRIEGVRNPTVAGPYQVVAAAIDQSGRLLSQFSYSPAFAIQPGPLAKIILNISPEQVADRPLVEEAQMVLLDAYNNLKVDYNLADSQITLQPDFGILAPAIINDTMLFDSGVINFLPLGVRYESPSNIVGIRATNGVITSTRVIVGFSGYDILKATDYQGDTIRQVIAGTPMTARVSLRNGGNLLAVPNPQLKAHFLSDTTTAAVGVTPTRDGKIDTVSISLPTANLQPGQDTLVFELKAVFTPGDSTYPVSATPLRVPVTIASPVTLTISPGSFAPHLVYAGVDFPISFTVNSASFSGPADSTALTVQLASAVGQPPLTTIFSGTPAYSSFQGGIINYQNLSARVDTTAGLQPGWYAVKLNYRLFSGSSILTLQNSYPDSLYVLPREAVAYSVSSLTPSTAAAGAEVAFSFNLTLNATSPVEIRPGSALLTVSGSGFSATVNMGTPDSLLHPGSNQLQAEAIFVPASQLGKNLTVSAVLNYRHPGSANYLSFSTSFGGETIPVSALPVVQVIRVDAVAPNQPRVNTGQKFQISCSIANVADARTGAIQLRLTSDGSSTFTPLLTIPSIDPLDTVQAFFDVTASTRENAVEVFRVDIVSEDIHRLPPIDNIALVTIQTPASLALSYTVFGGAGGFIGVGETFSLTVSLTNFGHADVSKGSYVLSTHGMNLGLVDTVGDISVLSPVSFTLLAPSQDTTVELTFSLTSVPLDLNTGQPAQIRDTSFTYTIQVVSANASVLVESQNVLTVPATEGTSLAFFDLTFTNRGASSITAARLDTISLGWGTSSGRGVILDGLVDQTLTGFYENGLLVSTADLRDSVMVLRFSDFGLPPLGTRTVEFRAQLLTQVPAGLGVMLDTGSIIVRYSGGPLSDLRVPVKTSSSAATVFHTFYVTTSADFAQSFMVENNPYRPLRGPARFNYVLSEASSVEFQIFTLTGELVYTKNLLEGTDGTQPGEHILEWDGRNDRGDIILNGVYVVSITLGKTGLNARLKLAVLK